VSDCGNEELLKLTLQAAVPMWIETLKRRPFDDVMRRAAAAGQVIAERGDVILYKSKKKGQTAAAFNSLAEGIACLAFARGGVRFLGLHFEARHPELEKTP